MSRRNSLSWMAPRFATALTLGSTRSQVNAAEATLWALERVPVPAVYGDSTDEPALFA